MLTELKRFENHKNYNLNCSCTHWVRRCDLIGDLLKSTDRDIEMAAFMTKEVLKKYINSTRKLRIKTILFTQIDANMNPNIS